MKRDMDIIRTIIPAVHDAKGTVTSIDTIDKAQFIFHAQLLTEGNLIEAELKPNRRGMARTAAIFRLTVKGHNVADAIADNTVWEKTKSHLAGASASWSLALLTAVAIEFAKKKLNLR